MFNTKVFLFALFCVAVLAQDFYWEDTEDVLSHTEDRYQRSYHNAIACPGQEKQVALCYPICRDGYRGVGPVCWERVCLFVFTQKFYSAEEDTLILEHCVPNCLVKPMRKNHTREVLAPCCNVILVKTSIEMGTATIIVNLVTKWMPQTLRIA